MTRAAPRTDDLLLFADIAPLAGVQVASLRKYVQRGAMPSPDRYVGRTPVWERRTIDAWLATRA